MLLVLSWFPTTSTVFVFFFQAEDGIRDADVTGVQTCALPIYVVAAGTDHIEDEPEPAALGIRPGGAVGPAQERVWRAHRQLKELPWNDGRRRRRKIGRASCRERVQVSEVTVYVREKEASYRGE